ncbi:MAG TPA: hypothetical protein ENJ11_00655, partial [Gammaproteobacteria bacterium]|nr:hypothetical protein [Gammaproteobacteria bacterium]
MNKSTRPPVSCLAFFLASLLSLVIAGLVFKTVFVAYTLSQFPQQSFADIGYALIWGLRFDLAAAAVFSLIACLLLWLFTFARPLKSPWTLLAIMLLVQGSLQIGDTVYFVEAGRHVSYEMRDALADASGLFMTAVTKHALFLVVSCLLLIVLSLVLVKAAQKLEAVFRGVSFVPAFKGQGIAEFFLILFLA